MSHAGASETALTAAAARAAHLIVDNDPLIFTDEFAAALLGDQAEYLIGFHRAHGTHLVLSGARAQATCRSRYTEHRLARSVGGGRTQYVILGAGLDSFAYRSELAGQVRVFEVDHPATQEWKRQQLSAGHIAIPGSELVADYMLPPGLRDAAGDAYAEASCRCPRRAASPGSACWPRRDVGPA